MAQPIEFTASETAGVPSFHYLPGENPPVTENWPGLYRNWPRGPNPFTEWAVSNGNTEEIAVYIGLVWRLTAGLARYAVPAYYRDAAARLLGRAPVLVDWEYETDAEQPTTALRDKGFVPGRAAVTIRPEPTAWQRANAGRAGLFPLTTPRDLVALLRAVLPDASGEITVFAVPPGPERLGRLTAALTGRARPALAEVLGGDGVFADLTIGSDEGYYDSVTVASCAPSFPDPAPLATACTRRVRAYEEHLPELPDIPAFLRAMPGLAGVELDSP